MKKDGFIFSNKDINKPLFSYKVTIYFTIIVHKFLYLVKNVKEEGKNELNHSHFIN